MYPDVKYIITGVIMKMKLHELSFKRRFSVNLYRNLRLKAGEMSMFKDWVNDKRGDPYPVLSRRGEVYEEIKNASYCLFSATGGEIRRFLGGFFPVYTYEFRIGKMKNCGMGFAIAFESGNEILRIMLNSGGKVTVDTVEEHFECGCGSDEGDVFSVTFRPGGVSVYINRGRRDEPVIDVAPKALDALRRYTVFGEACVSLVTELSEGGEARYDEVGFCLCGGISQADMKPMKYEDGTPVTEGGRVFLTMTSRLENESFQSVVSFNPTLCDFRLEGAMLFDCGDGLCCPDVASSVVYDRAAKRWYIWMCAFSHGHVLARGEITGDPRFGIQIIDVKLTDKWDGTDRKAFAAVKGDEDPDLVYIDGKWHLTVCRLEEKDGYHYYRFVSDNPLDGFVFADRTPTGGKTGGMFVRFEGEYYFVCGTDFDSRSRYDVYRYDDFGVRERLACNYDDGGFRGWGTVFGINVGSRVKYYWITFDRHNASGYNWSYGNIYLYEAFQVSGK